MKKEKNKSNRKRIIIWTSICAILVLIIIAITFYNISSKANYNSSNNQQNQNIGAQSAETQKSCREVQVPYQEIEEYQETVPYTDRECETKELAYSITNFVLNYDTCNKQEYICKSSILGICTDKVYYCVDQSISCSLTLKNLDSEESGTWQITLSYIDESTRNTIKNDAVSEFLYPQTEKTLNSAVGITSAGVEGDANKDLTCVYTATTIPTKQVCRDVTKYKEVTKTRTVTKYKTEQQCD